VKTTLVLHGYRLDGAVLMVELDDQVLSRLLAAHDSVTREHVEVRAFSVGVAAWLSLFAILRLRDHMRGAEAGALINVSVAHDEQLDVHGVPVYLDPVAPRDQVAALTSGRGVDLALRCGR